MRLLLLNGPNLNLIGTREPDVYGRRTFDDFLEQLRNRFPQVQLEYAQSNVEGELINRLHEARGQADGVILNAGGYTHTSVALADAVAAIGIPTVEVHISNVLAREDFRKTSYIAARCIGSISGLGLDGYALAVQYFLDRGREAGAA